MTGIYVITNTVNGKKYIGQSVNISQRWRAHRTRYQTENSYLYRAMRKYGLDSFTFEIIAECEEKDLNDLEQYWISVYQSNNPDFGYNLTAGGDAPAEVNFKISDEEVLQIYDLLRGGITQQEIADKFHISQQQVSLLNLGETRPQMGIVYPIIDTSKKRFYCIDCGQEVSFGAKRCKKCEVERRAEINYADKPTREELKDKLRTSNFTAIGKAYGVSDNAVRRWCDHYGLPRRTTDIKKMSDLEWSKI